MVKQEVTSVFINYVIPHLHLESIIIIINNCWKPLVIYHNWGTVFNLIVHVVVEFMFMNNNYSPLYYK